MSLGEELRYPGSIALARRELGRIDVAAGNLAGAERRLGEALEAFSGMDASFEVAVTRLDLAEVAGLRGDLDDATEQLERCRKSFAALGAPTYLDRAETLARRLYLALPDNGAAPARRRPPPG